MLRPIGTGHNLSLICQPTSEDMKLYFISDFAFLELSIGLFEQPACHEKVLGESVSDRYIACLLA